MDKQAFKQRMQNLKSYRENNPGKGYWDWRNSLPDNLKYTDDTEYDMVGAYNSGAQPTLEDDGSYHLPTRVPSTGKVLKSSIHPTYWKGLAEDERLGYHTYWLPDGSTYTASKYDVPIQAYQNGGRHALGVGQVFASLADMLFNKERRTPAIAAAAYHTIHQTQNDLALAPVEAPLIEPIVDAVKSADGKFIYKRNPDNDYIPNTAEHELSHFTDLLKSGRPDAHAGNNVFYQMTKDLTKRVGDKHDDYFLLPTEQKAHMNQLREWMFQNGYINRRDQKVTPEYMSKIMKQLNNVEGMKGVQRAAQQFKSNKTFTKWFNSVPLIGAGLLGVNKYFTDEDKQEK